MTKQSSWSFLHTSHEPLFQSERVPVLLTIGVGVLLWYAQALTPFLEQPIVQLLQALGILHPAASDFEKRMASAMLLRWVSALLLVAFVIWVERLPLGSLGFRKPRLGELYWAAIAAQAWRAILGSYSGVAGHYYGDRGLFAGARVSPRP